MLDVVNDSWSPLSLGEDFETELLTFFNRDRFPADVVDSFDISSLIQVGPSHLV